MKKIKSEWYRMEGTTGQYQLGHTGQISIKIVALDLRLNSMTNVAKQIWKEANLGKIKI